MRHFKNFNPSPTLARLPQVAGAVAVLLGSAAHADVRYTSEMKPETNGAGGSFRTTTFFKDHRERVETAISFGTVKMTNVTLNMCDKEQTVRLDPELKIYTVSPIGGQISAPPSRAPGAPEAPKGGDGKIVMTYNVQKLPDEKIGELDTKHAMITMRMQSSGCAGNSDSTMKFEIWTANIKTFNCPARYMASRTVQDPSGCKITYEIKGDSAAAQEAFGGMVVRQKIYVGDKQDKPVMTQDLREYSSATLDAALFEIPAGFKQVSAEDFQQQQQQALIKKFQSGAGEKDEKEKDEEEPETTKPAEKKDEVKLPGGLKVKKPKF